MIKASELRIGNWVNDRASMPFQIDGTDIVALMQCEIANKINLEYNPIPLTEGWLTKLGFEVIIWNGVMRQYYIYITSGKHCILSFTYGEHIDFPDRLEKVTIGIAPHRSGSCYGNFKIEYVHQVQNIYFATKGEELIYNEK